MEDFNELAKDWDGEPRRIDRAKIAAEFIRANISGLSGMEGLEYGCGTGLLSFNLQPFLKKIWLGDSSEGMLEVLRQKIEIHSITNMEPLRIDLTLDSLPGFKTDLIYTLMTLHHIQDIGELLKCFCDMLKTQGYLCIVDLDKEDGTFHDKDFTGHFGFDRGELASLLEESGLQVMIDEICYNNIKRDPDGIERTYPLFIMIGKKKEPRQ